MFSVTLLAGVLVKPAATSPSQQRVPGFGSPPLRQQVGRQERLRFGRQSLYKTVEHFRIPALHFS